jgi:hypothetical protein
VTAPAVVKRPIESVARLVNHKAPSGPAVIPKGELIDGSERSVTTPDVVIRPMELAELVNQMAPSGPAVIPKGALMPFPQNLLVTPAVVIRPMKFVSVKQRAPSGPEVMKAGRPADPGYAVITPAVVIRSIDPWE